MPSRQAGRAAPPQPFLRSFGRSTKPYGKRMSHPIYLDYSATTPVDPRVADKMIPYLREQFGNPASRSHAYGWEAEKAVEDARGEVAALVNCDPREIVWTSGATEAINLALEGRGQFLQGARQAPGHREDGAQGDARHHAGTRAPGLRGDLPRRAGRRPAGPGGARGRAAARHHPGIGDDGQQRDRRHPGHRGHRRDDARAQDHLPRRFGAGDRQG